MDVKRHQENPHLVWGDPAESIPPPHPPKKGKQNHCPLPTLSLLINHAQSFFLCHQNPLLLNVSSATSMQTLKVHIVNYQWKISLCTVKLNKISVVVFRFLFACSQLHKYTGIDRVFLWQARIQLDMHREVYTIRAWGGKKLKKQKGKKLDPGQRRLRPGGPRVSVQNWTGRGGESWKPEA